MRADRGLLKGRQLAALLSPLLCVACVSNSQARVADEARQLVQPGMPLSSAVGRLNNAKFSCDDRLVAGAVTCTRSRNYAILAGCLQRVDLIPVPGGSTVLRVEVPKPACTGM